jgi:DNA-binding FrmR family transcriptional regulator
MITATLPKSTASTAYLDAEVQNSLANRLARLEGHIRSIREMVLERRCADEILLQVAAVKAATNAFAAVLVEHELKDCMTTCMAGTDVDRLERVTRSLAALLKRS